MRRGWARAACYVVAVALIVRAAFTAGVAHEERTYCGPGGLDDNDCIFGFIAGYEWAAVAFVISAALIGVLELLIHKRSRVVAARAP